MTITVLLLQSSPLYAWTSAEHPAQGEIDLSSRQFSNQSDTGGPPVTFLEELATYGFDKDNPDHSLLLHSYWAGNDPVNGTKLYHVLFEQGTNGNITFGTQNANKYYVTTISTVRIAVTIGSDDQNAQYPGSNTWHVQDDAPTPYPSINNEALIGAVHKVYNVDYEPDWDGPTYSSYEDDNPVLPSCDTFDVICQTQNIFASIGNVFTGIAERIVAGIARLFQPDSSTMNQLFDDLRTLMETKLGFLAYPLTFIVDLFNAMINAPTCSDPCNITFGQFYGSDFGINITAIKSVSTLWWDFAVNAIRGTTVVALMLAFYRKWKEVLQS